MNSIGGLILLLSIGLLVVVGVPAMSNLIDDAQASNDTAIQQAATGGESVTAPLFTILGYLALLLGGILAIKAFS